MKRAVVLFKLAALLCVAALLFACGTNGGASSGSATSLASLPSSSKPAAASSESLPPSEPEPQIIEIATADGFLAMANAPEGQYVLTADIDLSTVTAYTPLEDFSGELDGGGHTITAPPYSGTGSFALFDKMAGTVKNLNLVGIDWQDAAGQSAALGGVAMDNQGSIQDCTVSGTIVSPLSAGGIARTNSGEILRCHSDIIITGGCNVGGIASSSSGTIADCTASGQIDSVHQGNTSSAGGIVARSSGLITGCVFSGVVTQWNEEHYSYAGGIVGENGGVVENCANTGSVTGAHEVGGIAGQSRSGETNIIRSCYNSGQVVISHYNIQGYAGGIVGFGYTMVQDCFNTGTVSGQGFMSTTGGIAGVCHSSGDMENCYNAGTIRGSVPGACVGSIWSNKVHDLYYISNGPAYGEPAGDGFEAEEATYVSADQASDEASFPTFDFDTVWVMEAAPMLRGIDYIQPE